LGPTDMVWAQGTPNWVPAAQVAGLTFAVSALPPPRPQPPPEPSPPEPGGTRYFYERKGKRYGPMSSRELRERAMAGQLDPTDPVWSEKTQQWAPASKFKNLFGG